jgi:hypothetical protein
LPTLIDVYFFFDFVHFGYQVGRNAVQTVKLILYFYFVYEIAIDSVWCLLVEACFAVGVWIAVVVVAQMAICMGMSICTVFENRQD